MVGSPHGPFPTDWRETHRLACCYLLEVLFVEGAREEGVVDRVWVALVNFVLALPASDLWRVMRGVKSLLWAAEPRPRIWVRTK